MLSLISLKNSLKFCFVDSFFFAVQNLSSLICPTCLFLLLFVLLLESYPKNIAKTYVKELIMFSSRDFVI